MPGPYVVALILNNNRLKDTLECLDSLKKNTYVNYSVFELDIDPEEGSVDAIRNIHPDVEITQLIKNLGYAGNNNIGIRAALEKGADWILLLNEDTILHSDCLTQLVEAGESDSRIGIVGPMVYHHNEPGVIQSAGGKLGPHWESLHLAQNERETGQFTAPHEVDWISGCAIMVRRALIEQVGELDERYFLYWEETEWCIRATRKGWHVVHVPQAKIWHKGVQSDSRPKPYVTYYTTRNRLLTMSKHHASWFIRLSVWGELLRTLASWTLKPKWRMMKNHRNALWKGMVDFLLRRWGAMV